MQTELNNLFQKAQELLGTCEAKIIEQGISLGKAVEGLGKKVQDELESFTKDFGPNRKIQIRVKRVNPKAKLPKYAHTGPRGDMAADIYAVEDMTLNPGEFYKAPTGLILQPPPGYGFKIRERSSQWFKAETMVGAGLGDPGYTEEYLIGIKNLGDKPLTIKEGDRIAQIQVIERIEGVFEDGNIEDTERKGGVGSTGK